MVLKSFPFDTQTCSLEFESNRFMIPDLVYVEELIFIEAEAKHQMWDVKKFNYSIENKMYDGYIDFWSILQLNLTLVRKPAYYIVNLMIPALFLLIINLATFFMPFADGVSTGMNVLLAYSVLAIQ